MDVSGIEEEQRVTTVVMSTWVCLYYCMLVCVGSSVRNPAVRSETPPHPPYSSQSLTHYPP